MSKNKSVAGILFYTFGTIFLMAVITVCAINFKRDSRFLQKPATTASADVNEGKGGPEKAQPEAVAGAKTNSDAKSSNDKTSKPVKKPSETNPAGSSEGSGGKSGDTGDTADKPQNPGEEP